MTTLLADLGRRIRHERKRLKIAAQTAAEAAEISRVTLHRIEHGEPTVAIGLYMRALAALGLGLEVVGGAATSTQATKNDDLEGGVRIDAYPQLRELAWQLHGLDRLPAQDALALYERNWRYVDHARMTPEEKALVKALVTGYGKGVLLV